MKNLSLFILTLAVAGMTGCGGKDSKKKSVRDRQPAPTGQEIPAGPSIPGGQTIAPGDSAEQQPGERKQTTVTRIEESIELDQDSGVTQQVIANKGESAKVDAPKVRNKTKVSVVQQSPTEDTDKNNNVRDSWGIPGQPAAPSAATPSELDQDSGRESQTPVQQQADTIKVSAKTNKSKTGAEKMAGKSIEAEYDLGGPVQEVKGQKFHLVYLNELAPYKFKKGVKIREDVFNSEQQVIRNLILSSDVDGTVEDGKMVVSSGKYVAVLEREFVDKEKRTRTQGEISTYWDNAQLLGMSPTQVRKLVDSNACHLTLTGHCIGYFKQAGKKDHKIFKIGVLALEYENSNKITEVVFFEELNRDDLVEINDLGDGKKRVTTDHVFKLVKKLKNKYENIEGKNPNNVIFSMAETKNLVLTHQEARKRIKHYHKNFDTKEAQGYARKMLEAGQNDGFYLLWNPSEVALFEKSQPDTWQKIYDPVAKSWDAKKKKSMDPNDTDYNVPIDRCALKTVINDRMYNFGFLGVILGTGGAPTFGKGFGFGATMCDADGDGIAEDVTLVRVKTTALGYSPGGFQLKKSMPLSWFQFNTEKRFVASGLSIGHVTSQELANSKVLNLEAEVDFGLATTMINLFSGKQYKVTGALLGGGVGISGLKSNQDIIVNGEARERLIFPVGYAIVKSSHKISLSVGASIRHMKITDRSDEF